MAHPGAYLTQRQDEIAPERITVTIPGFGALHGFIYSNGVRQFFGIPYGHFSKNWTRATMVTSWAGNEHDGTKLGYALLMSRPSLGA